MDYKKGQVYSLTLSTAILLKITHVNKDKNLIRAKCNLDGIIRNYYLNEFHRHWKKTQEPFVLLTK